MAFLNKNKPEITAQTLGIGQEAYDRFVDGVRGLPTLYEVRMRDIDTSHWSLYWNPTMNKSENNENALLLAAEFDAEAFEKLYADVVAFAARANAQVKEFEELKEAFAALGVHFSYSTGDNSSYPREPEFFPDWAEKFDDRQRRLIEACRDYERAGAPGLPAHNLMVIIAKMARLLDKKEYSD